MQTFLNTADDVKWLRETHLNAPQVPPFQSAVLYGNEDCPTRIELFAEADPVVTDPPTVVYELQEGHYLMVSGPLATRP